MLVTDRVFVRDDGRYADAQLKTWFYRLASGNGLCCSFADGVSVENVDWETQNGRYRVRMQGQWIVVPDTGLVTESNRFGPAVVWPYQDANGHADSLFPAGRGRVSRQRRLVVSGDQPGK